MDQISKTLGQKIKHIRRAVGMDRSYMSAIESGNIVSDIKLLIQ